MKGDVIEDLVPKALFNSTSDLRVARSAATLANRMSRRSFVSRAGRVIVATLGGASYLVLFRQEGAWADGCDTANGPVEEFNNDDSRATCMCSEVTGGNSCPNCCSSYWISCVHDQDDPAVCLTICHNQPPLVQLNKVRLWDCCAQCADKDTTNKAGCWDSKDDFCHNAGYCDPVCGSSGNGWRVKCVRKQCMNATCGQIIQNCN